MTTDFKEFLLRFAYFLDSENYQVIKTAEGFQISHKERDLPRIDVKSLDAEAIYDKIRK